LKLKKIGAIASLFLFSCFALLLGLRLSRLKRHWGLVHPRTVPSSLALPLSGGERGAKGTTGKPLGEQKWIGSGEFFEKREGRKDDVAVFFNVFCVRVPLSIDDHRLFCPHSEQLRSIFLSLTEIEKQECSRKDARNHGKSFTSPTQMSYDQRRKRRFAHQSMGMVTTRQNKTGLFPLERDCRSHSC